MYEIFVVDSWGSCHLMHLYHKQSQGLLHILYFQSLIGNSNFVNNITQMINKVRRWPLNIVCVVVLRPSQPNRAMSSAVSLPNHTFTGQA